MRTAALTLAETSDDLVGTGHEGGVLAGCVELCAEAVLTGGDIHQQVVGLCGVRVSEGSDRQLIAWVRTEDIALRGHNLEDNLTGANRVDDGELDVDGDGGTERGILGGRDDAADVAAGIVVDAAQTQLLAQEDGFRISPLHELFNAENIADQVADARLDGIAQQCAEISTATDDTTVCSIRGVSRAYKAVRALTGNNVQQLRQSLVHEADLYVVCVS